MAEKGVIIELDFTAIDGAGILFDTTKSFLRDLDGIAFDVPTEARYLAGTGYEAGLAKLFASVRTKKTAQKAARDLAAAFAEKVTAAAPGAITASFRNFVKALTEKGIRVVVSTRADLETVRPAFVSAFGDAVEYYQEVSPWYGTARWDSWRRACKAAGLSHFTTLVVSGSGAGVKSALLAGMGSVAVVNAHVAYQDFGGADDVVTELSASTARKVLGVLKA